MASLGKIFESVGAKAPAVPANLALKPSSYTLDDFDSWIDSSEKAFADVNDLIKGSGKNKSRWMAPDPNRDNTIAALQKAYDSSNDAANFAIRNNKIFGERSDYLDSMASLRKWQEDAKKTLEYFDYEKQYNSQFKDNADYVVKTGSSDGYSTAELDQMIAGRKQTNPGKIATIRNDIVGGFNDSTQKAISAAASAYNAYKNNEDLYADQDAILLSYNKQLSDVMRKTGWTAEEAEKNFDILLSVERDTEEEYRLLRNMREVSAGKDIYKTMNKTARELLDSYYYSPDERYTHKTLRELMDATGWTEEEAMKNTAQLKYYFDAKNAKDAAEESEKFAEAHPGIATLHTNIRQLWSGTFGALDFAGQELANALAGNPDAVLNINTKAQLPGIRNQAVRAKVASDIEEGKSTMALGFIPNPTNAQDKDSKLLVDYRNKNMPEWLGGGNVGSFIYNTGVSGIDSFVNRTVGMALGNVVNVDPTAFSSAFTNWVMGSSVARDTIAENVKAGKSNWEALSKGTLYGMVEGITEAVGGEFVVNAFSRAAREASVSAAKAIAKAYLSAALKSMAAEGIEEVFANWMDAVVDRLYNGNKGALDVAFEKVLAENPTMSKDEAAKKALISVIGNDAGAFLSGALSTFGDAAVGTIRSYSSLNHTASELTKAGYSAKEAKRQAYLLQKILTTEEEITNADLDKLDLNNSAVRKVYAKATGLDGLLKAANLGRLGKRAYVEKGRGNLSALRFTHLMAEDTAQQLEEQEKEKAEALKEKLESAKADAEEKAAPAEEKAAPAEEKAAPAEEKAAPAEEKATAPTEEKAKSAEEKTAPAEEKAAPAEEKSTSRIKTIFSKRKENQKARADKAAAEGDKHRAEFKAKEEERQSRADKVRAEQAAEKANESAAFREDAPLGDTPKKPVPVENRTAARTELRDSVTEEAGDWIGQYLVENNLEPTAENIAKGRTAYIAEQRRLGVSPAGIDIALKNFEAVLTSGSSSATVEENTIKEATDNGGEGTRNHSVYSGSETESVADPESVEGVRGEPGGEDRDAETPAPEEVPGRTGAVLEGTREGVDARSLGIRGGTGRRNLTELSEEEIASNRVYASVVAKASRYSNGPKVRLFKGGFFDSTEVPDGMSACAYHNEDTNEIYAVVDAVTGEDLGSLVDHELGHFYDLLSNGKFSEGIEVKIRKTGGEIKEEFGNIVLDYSENRYPKETRSKVIAEVIFDINAGRAEGVSPELTKFIQNKFRGALRTNYMTGLLNGTTADTKPTEAQPTETEVQPAQPTETEVQPAQVESDDRPFELWDENELATTTAEPSEAERSAEEERVYREQQEAQIASELDEMDAISQELLNELGLEPHGSFALAELPKSVKYTDPNLTLEDVVAQPHGVGLKPSRDDVKVSGRLKAMFGQNAENDIYQRMVKEWLAKLTAHLQNLYTQKTSPGTEPGQMIDESAPANDGRVRTPRQTVRDRILSVGVPFVRAAAKEAETRYWSAGAEARVLRSGGKNNLVNQKTVEWETSKAKAEGEKAAMAAAKTFMTYYATPANRVFGVVNTMFKQIESKLGGSPVDTAIQMDYIKSKVINAVFEALEQKWAMDSMSAAAKARLAGKYNAVQAYVTENRAALASSGKFETADGDLTELGFKQAVAYTARERGVQNPYEKVQLPTIIRKAQAYAAYYAGMACPGESARGWYDALKAIGGPTASMYLMEVRALNQKSTETKTAVSKQDNGTAKPKTSAFSTREKEARVDLINRLIFDNHARGTELETEIKQSDEYVWFTNGAISYEQFCQGALGDIDDVGSLASRLNAHRIAEIQKETGQNSPLISALSKFSGAAFVSTNDLDKLKGSATEAARVAIKTAEGMRLFNSTVEAYMNYMNGGDSGAFERGLAELGAYEAELQRQGFSGAMHAVVSAANEWANNYAKIAEGLDSASEGYRAYTRHLLGLSTDKDYSAYMARRAEAAAERAKLNVAESRPARLVEAATAVSKLSSAALELYDKLSGAGRLPRQSSESKTKFENRFDAEAPNYSEDVETQQYLEAHMAVAEGLMRQLLLSNDNEGRAGVLDNLKQHLKNLATELSSSKTRLEEEMESVNSKQGSGADDRHNATADRDSQYTPDTIDLANRGRPGENMDSSALGLLKQDLVDMEDRVRELKQQVERVERSDEERAGASMEPITSLTGNNAYLAPNYNHSFKDGAITYRSVAHYVLAQRASVFKTRKAIAAAKTVEEARAMAEAIPVGLTEPNWERRVDEHMLLGYRLSFGTDGKLAERLVRTQYQRIEAADPSGLSKNIGSALSTVRSELRSAGVKIRATTNDNWATGLTVHAAAANIMDSLFPGMHFNMNNAPGWARVWAYLKTIDSPIVDKAKLTSENSKMKMKEFLDRAYKMADRRLNDLQIAMYLANAKEANDKALNHLDSYAYVVKVVGEDVNENLTMAKLSKNQQLKPWRRSPDGKSIDRFEYVKPYLNKIFKGKANTDKALAVFRDRSIGRVISSDGKAGQTLIDTAKEREAAREDADRRIRVAFREGHGRIAGEYYDVDNPEVTYSVKQVERTHRRNFIIVDTNYQPTFVKNKSDDVYPFLNTVDSSMAIDWVCQSIMDAGEAGVRFVTVDPESAEVREWSDDALLDTILGTGWGNKYKDIDAALLSEILEKIWAATEEAKATGEQVNLPVSSLVYDAWQSYTFDGDEANRRANDYQRAYPGSERVTTPVYLKGTVDTPGGRMNENGEIAYPDLRSDAEKPNRSYLDELGTIIYDEAGSPDDSKYQPSGLLQKSGTPVAPAAPVEGAVLSAKDDIQSALKNTFNWIRTEEKLKALAAIDADGYSSVVDAINRLTTMLMRNTKPELKNRHNKYVEAKARAVKSILSDMITAANIIRDSDGVSIQLDRLSDGDLRDLVSMAEKGNTVVGRLAELGYNRNAAIDNLRNSIISGLTLGDWAGFYWTNGAGRDVTAAGAESLSQAQVESEVARLRQERAQKLLTDQLVERAYSEKIPGGRMAAAMRDVIDTRLGISDAAKDVRTMNDLFAYAKSYDRDSQGSGRFTGGSFALGKNGKPVSKGKAPVNAVDSLSGYSNTPGDTSAASVASLQAVINEENAKAARDYEAIANHEPLGAPATEEQVAEFTMDSDKAAAFAARYMTPSQIQRYMDRARAREQQAESQPNSAATLASAKAAGAEAAKTAGVRNAFQKQRTGPIEKDSVASDNLLALSEAAREALDGADAAAGKQAIDRLEAAMLKAVGDRATDNEWLGEIEKAKAEQAAKDLSAAVHEAAERVRAEESYAGKKAKSDMGLYQKQTRNGHFTNDFKSEKVLKTPGPKLTKLQRLRQILMGGPTAIYQAIKGTKIYNIVFSDIGDLEGCALLEDRIDTLDARATAYKKSQSTTTHILDEALVSPSGEIIDRGYRDVFVCYDADGKYDEAAQSVFERYLLLMHHIDRASLLERVLDKIHEFEGRAGNEWTQNFKSDAKISQDGLNEFARMVSAGNPTAVEYAKLLQEYRSALTKTNEGNLTVLRSEKDRTRPMSVDEAKAELRAITDEQAWVVDKAEGYYSWIDNFFKSWVVGSDLTLEQYEATHDMYPHWVPVGRVDEEGNEHRGAGGSFASRNSINASRSLRKAEGSLRDIVPLNIQLADTIAGYVKARRGWELQSQIATTAFMDTGVGKFSDYFEFNYDFQDNKRYWLNLSFEGPLQEREEEFRKMWAENRGNDHGISPRTMTCYINGEKVSVYLSEGMLRSLKNLMSPQKSEEQRAFEQTGSLITSPSKALLTSYNPAFVLTNPMKDLGNAVQYSIAGAGIVTYFPRAIKEMSEDSNNWSTFKALGGTRAGYYWNEAGFLSESLKREGKVSKLNDAVLWAGEHSESLTRFAEYLATLDRVGDSEAGRMYAIKRSAQVTLDFERGGSGTKMLNHWVRFLNPNVQAIDQFFTKLMAPERAGEAVKSIAARFGKMAAYTILGRGIVEGLLFAWRKAAGMDDDWDELNSYIKDRYYCIPLKGTGKFLKLPKDQVWALLVNSPISRLLAYLDGDEDAFDNYWEDAGKTVFEVNGLLEGGIIGSAAVDLARNEDSTGRTIVPKAYSGLDKSEQWNKDTSVIAKAVADLFDSSPMQVDYLINNYLGSFAKELLVDSALSMGIFTGDETFLESVRDGIVAAGLTTVNRFVGDPVISNAGLSSYYDMLDDINEDRGLFDVMLSSSLPESITRFKGRPEANRSTVAKLDDLLSKWKKSQSENEKARLEEQGRELIAEALGATDEQVLADRVYSALMSTNGYGKRISEINRQASLAVSDEEKRELRQQMNELAGEAVDFYKRCRTGEISNPLAYMKGLKYGDDVAEAFDDLERVAGEYSYEPTKPTKKEVSHPTSSLQKYILTDAQLSKWQELYEDAYATHIKRAMRSSEYVRGNIYQRAQALQDAENDATDEARSAFTNWLQANSVEPELYDRYKGYDKNVLREIIRLEPIDNSKLAFTPVVSPSKYTDPNNKQNEYVLNDEYKEMYYKLYEYVYSARMAEAMADPRYATFTDAQKAAYLTDIKANRVNPYVKELIISKMQKDGFASTPKDVKEKY